MDRKTLLAFGLIAVVLIFTPWYMSLVSPPAKTTAPELQTAKQPQNDPVKPVPAETSLKKYRVARLEEKESFIEVNNGLNNAQ